MFGRNMDARGFRRCPQVGSVELSGVSTLVLVDDAPTGHLNIDDVWLWQ